jgi:type I restriction enzyme S subunit
MKWPTIKLGELAEFKNGINYSAQQVGSGIPVYGVANFQKETYAYYDGLDEVDSAAVRTEDLIKENDILFVRSNGNRNLIGRSVFVRKLIRKVTHSGFTIRCRFNSDLVYPRFYGYVFKTKIIKNVLVAQGGGTNINNLNQQILSDLEVPLPPLDDQIRISSLLEQYDELIEVNRAKIEILSNAIQRVFREWFVEFNFKTNENLIDSGHSSFGMIPNGWSLCKVGDVCEKIFSGGTPSTQNSSYWNGEISWLSSGETREPWIIDTDKRITKEGVQNSSTRFAPKNTIVIASAGQGKTRGQSSLLDIETYINQSVIALIANEEKVTPLFLHTFFQLNYDFLRKISDSSSSRGSLTIPDLRQLNILVPPLEMQQKLPAIDKLLPLLMRQNKNLVHMRDLLLPKFVSGEIDVSEISKASIQNLISKTTTSAKSARNHL